MTASLRIVSFNVFPRAHARVAAWASRHGHQIVLVVTSPTLGGARYRAGHQELVATADPTQDILVTTRLRRTAQPLIAALEPDLIISATFPRRIPAEVAAIPRYGALNLHPTPLPRGRGPNPQRLIYEGDQVAAAVLHRLAPEFDAGAILSLRSRPLPDDLTSDDILTTWTELMTEALDEGVARAVAGEPGEPQDEALATYAAPFQPEERELRWDEPARTIQRRAAALNLATPLAWALIDGRPVPVATVRACAEIAPRGLPGTVLGWRGDAFIVSVTDGAVEVIPCSAASEAATAIHPPASPPGNYPVFTAGS